MGCAGGFRRFVNALIGKGKRGVSTNDIVLFRTVLDLDGQLWQVL